MNTIATSVYWTPERRLRFLFALGCTALAAWLAWTGLNTRNSLVSALKNQELGFWSMRFLLAALVLSPISRLAREPGWKRWRRPFGLAAFGFAVAHTIHYIVYAMVWPNHLYLLLVLPYLLVGTLALALLIPLAVTSNNVMVRRLGPKAWRGLHAAVYLIAPLALLHEVLAYGAVLGEAWLHAIVCGLALAAKWAQIRNGRGLPSARRCVGRSTPPAKGVPSHARSQAHHHARHDGAALFATMAGGRPDDSDHC